MDTAEMPSASRTEQERLGQAIVALERFGCERYVSSGWQPGAGRALWHERRYPEAHLRNDEGSLGGTTQGGKERLSSQRAAPAALLHNNTAERQERVEPRIV
jgi:hypothetical protein